MNIIPGTVCCLLCRGMVIYKDGDKTRFRAHMNNEHGAFFDIDYLLASCLLEEDQKEAIARTVKAQDKVPAMLEENNVHDGVTLRENAYNHPPVEMEENAPNLMLKKEKVDIPEDFEFQRSSTGAQFGTQAAPQQYQEREGKKEKLKKKTIECDACGQYYTTKQSLRAHKEKMHAGDSNIKRERYDDPKMNPNLMFQNYPQNTTETLVNNRNSYDSGNSGVTEGYGGYYDGNNSENYSSNTNPGIHQGDNSGSYSSSYESHEPKGNQSREDELNQKLHEAMRQDPGYVDQVLSEARSLNPTEFDQTMNKPMHGKKRNADDLDEMLDETRDQSEELYENEESSTSVDKSASVGNASERFYCQVESCGRSYTAKSNKQIHERKAHNILSTRAKNKKFKMATEEQEPQKQNGVLEVKEKESNVQWDELEKIRAQYYNSPARKTNTETLETREPSADGDSGALHNLEGTFSRPFSPNPSKELGSGETTTDKLVTSKAVVDGVDISQSRYFSKNPNAITTARGKSVALFTEIPSGLPPNWKMRSAETTNKAGGKGVTRHFLSPELKVLKTGLAVVEYLRLKGELDTEQILEISQVLNISEGKLKSLYQS